MSLTKIKSPSQAGKLRGALLAMGCLLAISCKGAEVPQPAAEPDLGCGPQICAEGATLREVYAGPVETWPTVETTNDTPFEEMALLDRPVPAERSAMARLGEALFFDPILSASGQIACASCHHPDLAFTDGIRSSIGHDRQQGKRNAPTLLDKADQPVFMWDGAASASVSCATAGSAPNRRATPMAVCVFSFIPVSDFATHSQYRAHPIM